MWNASRFVHTLRHKEWLTCRYLISNILWSPVWLIHSNPAAVCSQHLGGKDPSSWTDKFLVTSCYCFYWPLSFPTDSLDHCKSPSLCFSACVCVRKKSWQRAPHSNRGHGGPVELSALFLLLFQGPRWDYARLRLLDISLLTLLLARSSYGCCAFPWRLRIWLQMTASPAERQIADSNKQ